MNNENSPRFQYVETHSNYSKVVESFGSEIDINAELPQPLFRRIGSKYSFIDFDPLLYRGFWSASALLREACADRGARLVVAMLDPLNIDGEIEFCIPPAFSIDPLASAQDYEDATEEAITTSNPQISISLIARRVAIAPTDNSWVVYGLRRDEVGILAHPGLEVQSLGAPWMNAREALETYSLKHRCNKADGEEFKRAFLLNYLP